MAPIIDPQSHAFRVEPVSEAGLLVDAETTTGSSIGPPLWPSAPSCCRAGSSTATWRSCAGRRPRRPPSRSRCSSSSTACASKRPELRDLHPGVGLPRRVRHRARVAAEADLPLDHQRAAAVPLRLAATWTRAATTRSSWSSTASCRSWAASTCATTLGQSRAPAGRSAAHEPRRAAQAVPRRAGVSARA